MLLDEREIGPDSDPLVIVEIGINHGGSFEKAKQMVRDAAEKGAECVKFQAHIPDAEMTDDEVIPENADEPIQQLIERFALSMEEHKELKSHVESFGMTYLCTPFSKEAADFLEEMDVCAYKIGSGECHNYPLIEYIASFGKPIILSTGMNELETIERSVDILKTAGVDYGLLQCTSMYPTPYTEANLGAIEQLQETFPDAVVGLSDHTQGIYIPLAAVAKGASILEKHFISNKSWPGPDVPVSIDPDELEELLAGVTAVRQALGGEKRIVDGEKPTIEFAYASVVAATDIQAGDQLTDENLWTKRPGTGEVLADEYYKLLGMTTVTDIPAGTQLEWGMIDE